MRLLAIAVAMVAATQAMAVSPYAGQQHRAIKALSADEVQGYLAGRGMGFAKAAELNHYPGPKHVLEMADQLALSDEQRARTQALFDDMQARAQRLGEELVNGEQALEQLFASGSVTPEALQSRVAALAEVRGRLRYTHLVTHLAQRDILTADQLKAYDQLRGYGDGMGHQHGAGHMH